MTPSLRIGVPKEVRSGEHRVSVAPDAVVRLIKLGFEVCVESGSGVSASFKDQDYVDAGAAIAGSAEDVWQSDIVLKINPPTEAEVGQMKSGASLFSMIWPAQHSELLDRMKAQGITAVAMDCVPRISRAQKMDVLSSMANIAGYRAIVEAAGVFGRFFTGQITAAGKVPPAKVLVIGAGVAGLSAIGTARGMGAIVRAFDTRPSVKEQVESMGALFLELDFEEDGEGSGGYAKVMSKEFIDAEMKLFAEQAEDVDIIVTTALIPGKPAPKLITKAMVDSMKAGSVVVDLAAERGGNCEYTEADTIVEVGGVKIVGFTDLPSRLPTQSSRLFGSNLCHMLSDMTAKGKEPYKVDFEDEVVRGATVVKDGEITWPPPEIAHPAPTPAPAEKKVPDHQTIHSESEDQSKSFRSANTTLILAGVVLALLGQTAPGTFLSHFSTFVLAIIIGWQVVWSVTPALHTPLMSVTNAISGIIIVGALVQVTGVGIDLPVLLALVAILLASINIAGGFLVTKRMLKMFHK